MRPQSQFPHSCVCESLYIPRISPHIFLQQKRQIDLGIYKSLTDTRVFRNFAIVSLQCIEQKTNFYKKIFNSTSRKFIFVELERVSLFFKNPFDFSFKFNLLIFFFMVSEHCGSCGRLLYQGISFYTPHYFLFHHKKFSSRIAYPLQAI